MIEALKYVIDHFVEVVIIIFAIAWAVRMARED